MRHPIYSMLNFKKLQSNILDIKLGKIRFEDLPEAKIMSHSTYNQLSVISWQIIHDNNNTIISASSDEWNSKISADTLKKINFSDVVFPFKVATIMTKDSTYYYSDLRDIGTDKFGSVSIVKSSRSGKQYGALISSSEDYIRFIDELDSEFFAIITYMAMFKSDVTRVSKPKSISNKHSKRSPKHKISVITLNQKITINESEAVSKREKSDKTWIVRGHFRNQYYSKTKTNKPKWIDPYWKGLGLNIINKFYKV